MGFLCRFVPTTFSRPVIELKLLQERTKRAATLKTKGNSAYQQRQFSKAAQLYTQAIQMSVTPEAVFYSNRAACRYLSPHLIALTFLSFVS